MQRGSTESKKLDKVGKESDEEQKVGRYAERRLAALGQGRRLADRGLLALARPASWALFFLGSLLAQSIAGPRRVQRRAAAASSQDPVVLGGYSTSADFWNRTLQNWQSEFLAVCSMVLFSIYLRQRGSPESKPVGAPHDATAQEG